jgi:hypothetical protein
MSWYALEKIEEALNETKDFLTPFDFALWTRLAVLVLLVGGGLNSMPSGSYPSPDSGGEFSNSNLAFSGSDMTSSMHNGLMPNTGDMMTGAFHDTTGLGIAIVGLVAVIALVFAVLSTIARFAFFQSAMEKQVSLRSMFKSNFANGLQLIGFNLLVAVFAALPMMPYLVGLAFDSVAGALFLVVALIYWLGLILAMTFVNDFGLPLMVSEKINILDAAKRALGAVRREKGQAAVYFLTKIGVGIVLGILSLVAFLVVFLGLLIPFGTLGAIAFVLSPVAGGVILFLGLLTLSVIMLYVQVPLETYRHYFYLLNLEEFEDVELVER